LVLQNKNAFSSSQNSRSPDLPVKSRSREVAENRHGSFCELGCGLAATLVTQQEVFEAADDHVQSLRVFAAFGDDEMSLAFAGSDVQ
jgi:hypothetical protein